MYENIVCRYEALVSTKHIFIVVVILQENHVGIRLGNPIAAIDRLQVSFVDSHANLIPQPAPCNFQLMLLKKEDESLYGGATTNDSTYETRQRRRRRRRQRRK